MIRHVNVQSPKKIKTNTFHSLCGGSFGNDFLLSYLEIIILWSRKKHGMLLQCTLNAYKRGIQMFCQCSDYEIELCGVFFFLSFLVQWVIKICFHIYYESVTKAKSVKDHSFDKDCFFLCLYLVFWYVNWIFKNLSSGGILLKAAQTRFCE